MPSFSAMVCNMQHLEHSQIKSQRWDNLPRGTYAIQDDTPIELIMSIKDKQSRDVVAYFYGVGSQEDMNCAILELMDKSEVEQCFGDLEEQHNLESLIRFVKAIAQAYKYDSLFPIVLSRVFEKHHHGLSEIARVQHG